MANRPHTSIGVIRAGRFDIDCVLTTSPRRPPAAELWPILGEYPVYDSFVYSVMAQDEVRNAAYRSALRALAADRVVLEIGTGPFALWARESLSAGASMVFAIEAEPSVALSARDLISDLGLADRIHVVSGLSTQIALPRRADLCVSEIIGSIASSEGAIAFIGDARRRLLSPQATVIPSQAVSQLAGVRLPDHLHARPALSPAAARYASRIFEHIGRPFDLRLGLVHLDTTALVTSTETVESIRFDTCVPPSETAMGSLRTISAGRCDGVLAWMVLTLVSGGHAINSLTSSTSWLPVFIPCFYPGIVLTVDDVIDFEWTRILSQDAIHPDYHLAIHLHSRRICRHFHVELPYRGSFFRAQPFYRALFPREPRPSKSDDALENVT